MKPGRIFPIIAALMLGVSVSAQAATIQISMENLEIMPAQVSAKVGDTIEWINKDVLAHTATARNGDFDVMLPPKKTGTLVVTKAGTFEYYCRFHPNMERNRGVRDGNAGLWDRAGLEAATKPFCPRDETNLKRRALIGACAGRWYMGISNVCVGDRVFCNVRRDHFSCA
jgi:plastocyanin